LYNTCTPGRVSLWLSVFSVVFIWSAINPFDYFVWFLEVLPALMYLIAVFAMYKRFPLTPVVYWLILFHAVILMIGGHYSYAEVPLFNWLRDEFSLSRNHYDKVGHFVQGFVPALISREILIRTSPLKPGKWLFFIVVCVCLAISAVYELIEGWSLLRQGLLPKLFTELRDMYGILSRTWRWHLWAH